jgi:hypothetical protein
MVAAATITKPAIQVTAGGRIGKWTMRFGETNPPSPPTGIGGRPLRAALAGSMVSNRRNKANRAETIETVCQATGPEPLARICPWRNKATASPRPHGAPPPTGALGQIYKTNLRNFNEINDTGSIGAWSRTPCRQGKPTGQDLDRARNFGRTKLPTEGCRDDTRSPQKGDCGTPAGPGSCSISDVQCSRMMLALSPITAYGPS